LIVAFFITSQAFGQALGPLEVNIQGTIFDRHEPPGPTTSVSEPFDFSSNRGAKVILSASSVETGFNIAIFTSDPDSVLFNTFQVPGGV